ncbi:MAG: methionyl-tRNA formyltransferase [Deltaproteobacteria bacterium]
MRVVFMGTPDFAVPSLRALIEGSDEVVAVITQPDRPKGRHGVLTPSPVKVLAIQHGIPVYQPVKVKDRGFLSTLGELSPDIIVVVAYGQILSNDILDLPPRKCINIHASLLPKYRGSSPINWALINGETVSGVTSMIITEGLDSGPILLKREVIIEDEDDAQALHDKLSKAGGELLLETMEGIRKGSLTPVSQDESEATYFPMLKKTDGEITWSQAAIQIKNRIRGLTLWPGTYTHMQMQGAGVMLKIYKAEIVPSPLTGEGEGEIPGTIINVDDNGIFVVAGKDCLLIKELQMEGKRRMTAGEFIRGHKIEKGMVLGRNV